MIQKCLIQRGIVKLSLGDGGFRWLRHLRYKNFQKLKIKLGLGRRIFGIVRLLAIKLNG